MRFFETTLGHSVFLLAFNFVRMNRFGELHKGKAWTLIRHWMLLFFAGAEAITK